MKLLIGLGNPGKDYAATRHNAGFMAMDFLAGHFGLPPFRFAEKHKSEITEGEIAGEKIMLIKPQTYMNLSGQAAQSVACFYKIPAKDIVAVYDEASLPFGALRIRPDGSAGGHNGVKSLIGALGAGFARVRLGIGPEKSFPGPLEDYVLGKLAKEEKTLLNRVIKKLPAAIEILLRDGIEEAMHQFNGM